MTSSDGSTDAGSLGLRGRALGEAASSAMAGVLAHSGYHVPKAIKGNATNPSGFDEQPRWVVDFHRELLGRRHVRPRQRPDRACAPRTGPLLSEQGRYNALDPGWRSGWPSTPGW